jgi:hypothetical protein
MCRRVQKRNTIWCGIRSDILHPLRRGNLLHLSRCSFASSSISPPCISVRFSFFLLYISLCAAPPLILKVCLTQGSAFCVPDFSGNVHVVGCVCWGLYLLSWICRGYVSSELRSLSCWDLQQFYRCVFAPVRFVLMCISRHNSNHDALIMANALSEFLQHLLSFLSPSLS